MRGPGEQARENISRGRPFRLVGVLLVSGFLAGGCSTPSETDRDNRRLLDAILTAITLKNATWLEDDAALAETRHQAGHFTDEEYGELRSIIETARSGDWVAAEREGYEFRRGHPFVADGH
jgi:hypothetical protein